MASHLWNFRQGGDRDPNHAVISPPNSQGFVTSATTLPEPSFDNNKFSWTQHWRSHSNSSTTCRLCNQVFSSIEDLISHIDTHIAHEEGNSGNLNALQGQITSERRQVPNRFSPNISVAMKMQGTRNHADNRTVRVPQQPAAMAPTRRHSFSADDAQFLHLPIEHTQPLLQSNSSVSGNSNVRGRMDSSNLEMLKMMESPSENTRPYIKQLEKPIEGVEIIDLVDEDKELKAVDLSLRL